MKFRIWVGVIAAAAVSVGAIAQTVTAAKSSAEAKAAIEARKAHFETIKKTFEPLTAMLKNQRPMDAALVATNAAKLQELLGAIPAKYAIDTRQFKDTKTDARDAVWASAADFKAKTDASVAAAGAVATIAKSGEVAGIKKSLADLGKTCGACHDNFKAKAE
jgi:cytochrome c556